jgi:uncharacterized protein (DUF2345 family)
MADREEEAQDGAVTTTPSRTLQLGSGYSLEVVAADAGSVGAHEQLVLTAGDGKICLRVTLGPDGPAVSIEAASLSIQSRGAMHLAGREVSIESEEGLRLRSGGAISIEADQAMSLKAREQHLEATHGDVHVEANDDVRLDGERVRLNAPDAAPLRRPGST